jgi:hypothetical protein
MKLRLVKSRALYTPMVPERIVARLDNQANSVWICHQLAKNVWEKASLIVKAKG